MIILFATSMKLFFKRAPEMQAMLGRLLLAATNDTSNQDTHDRALFYYRLLATDVEVAQKVVGASGYVTVGTRTMQGLSRSGKAPHVDDDQYMLAPTLHNPKTRQVGREVCLPNLARSALVERLF